MKAHQYVSSNGQNSLSSTGVDIFLILHFVRIFFSYHHNENVVCRCVFPSTMIMFKTSYTQTPFVVRPLFQSPFFSHLDFLLFCFLSLTQLLFSTKLKCKSRRRIEAMDSKIWRIFTHGLCFSQATHKTVEHFYRF